MKTYYSIEDCHKKKDIFRVLTLGMYDGVHQGHQHILNKISQDAIDRQGEAILLTFAPHPRQVLQGMDSVKLLSLQEEKITLLKKTNIHTVIFHEFTKEFSRLTATEFVRNLLVNKLKIDKLVIGYDHHFGRNREGNIENLRELSNLYGFEIEQISEYSLKNIAISSSKIRKALQEGNVKLANNYLDYKYNFKGMVVKGKQLGSKIGFPTANIEVPNYKLIPKKGVYAVKINWNKQSYNAVLNIGNNPTVNGTKTTIEAHLLNFDQDIYNQSIKVKLIDFIREEIKFENIDHLVNQIKKDIIVAQAILKE